MEFQGSQENILSTKTIRLDGSGFKLQWWQEIFFSPRPFGRTLYPTQPTVQWVHGLSPPDKAVGVRCLITHTHLEPNLMTTGIPLLPLCAMACYGVKLRNIFQDRVSKLRINLSVYSLHTWRKTLKNM
jgi:hypothetical protein